MPRHADKEWTVMTVVCWPPVLRSGHQLFDVLFHSGQIEGLEFGGVVEVFSQRIAHRRVLMQDLKIQLIGPPVSIRHGSSGCISIGRIFESPADNGTLTDILHVLSSGYWSTVFRRVRAILRKNGCRDAQHCAARDDASK